MTRPIYMDHHATTPVDARVLERMLPFFRERFGNAASTHAQGKDAKDAVAYARAQTASLLGADPAEIAFTSGATESDNLAIKGVMHALKADKDHLVTLETEHKAVLDSARRLEREGFRVSYLPVDAEGRVDPEEVAAAIGPKTALVSVMLVNNETGTTQDLEAIGRVTREREVWFHTDATQGLGRVELDLDAMNIDLASFTAHKVHGPKGVGGLYVRRRDRRAPIVAEMDGGGHERGMRSGTLNVPGIVGLGEACQLLADEGQAERAQMSKLRDALRQRIEAADVGALLNGAEPPWRHPGNLNLSFEGADGSELLRRLAPVVAVSSGAACNSAHTEPSYVLRAMGMSSERASSSLRFGIGRDNTMAEVERVAAAVVDAVRAARA
ncbi:MAG: cysteine desulfurase [Deltaproteobacteria bacterium]|nr:cysteine desulfurase [Deltaproteobacteria bacterium]